jgi:hypothetical protein
MKLKIWKSLVQFFLWLAGIMLFITAAAKITSSFGQAPILMLPDPILMFSFRTVLIVIGCIELFVAIVCVSSRRIVLQAGLVAALSSTFTIYRFGLAWIGYKRPCQCMGNLTEILHISPETADTAMKIVLGYLLVGSYASLFWLWRQKLQNPSKLLQPESPISAA